MATPTRLSIYNGALEICGSPSLANLTEDREARYLLDEAWDRDTIDGCLESGFWNHAMRTVQIDYSPSVEPPFGYRRAFDKPTDLKKLVSLCSDEYFRCPLYQYQDEGNYWFCELDTIYVRFVSNGNAYGMDFSLWPVSFTRFVEATFASRIIKRLTDGKEDEDTVLGKLKMARTTALASDALKEPVSFPPPTGWQMARTGRRSGRWYERG
jgi:hypothetical protein